MPFGDSNNFVGQEGNGWVAYRYGVRLGVYATQQEAEQGYNAAYDASKEGQGGGGPGLPIGWQHDQWAADYAQRDAQFYANMNYLMERLRMLEIEEMRRLDERERHRLALESAIARVKLTGIIHPSDFAAFQAVEGGLNALGDMLGSGGGAGDGQAPVGPPGQAGGFRPAAQPVLGEQAIGQPMVQAPVQGPVGGGASEAQMTNAAPPVASGGPGKMSPLMRPLRRQTASRASLMGGLFKSNNPLEQLMGG